MLVLDKIEGAIAVIECNGDLIEIPRSELPPKVREGDVLKIVIDDDETNNRKDKIRILAQEVFE